MSDTTNLRQERIELDASKLCESFEIDMQVDFTTDNLLVKGWERWEAAYGKAIYTPVTPHIWIPKLSIPAAIAVGAAAAIIKNPEVTRRFWTGWFNSAPC